MYQVSICQSLGKVAVHLIFFTDHKKGGKAIAQLDNTCSLAVKFRLQFFPIIRKMGEILYRFCTPLLKDTVQLISLADHMKGGISHRLVGGCPKFPCGGGWGGAATDQWHHGQWSHGDPL